MSLTTWHWIVFLVIFVPPYLIPSIIGFSRKHQNAAAIFALNLLLGWTFLGWVAALVWSVTATRKVAQ